MSCTLQQIQRVCRSVGGLRRIRVVLPEHVAAEPQQYCSGQLGAGIFLHEGKTALDILFAPGTARLKEKLQPGGRSGAFYEQEVTCFLPGDQVSVAVFLETLKNQRFHLDTLDADGIYRWLRLMRLEAEYDTGDRTGDRKGTRLRFTGASVKRAAIWSGVLVSGMPAENWTDSDGGWFDSDGGWDDTSDVVPQDPVPDDTE